MPDTDAHTLGSVAELERMARDLHTALAGDGFRKRRRMVLPLLTTDPEGFPRVALLTLGEVRANSASELAVAVRADSRTAFNLVRRGTATLLFMNRRTTASVQARAGRGRASGADPARRALPAQGRARPRRSPGGRRGRGRPPDRADFGGAGAAGLFSDELFDELGKVRPE